MNETLQNYSNFFNDQINELVSAYRHVLRAPIAQLISNDGAFAATVHGLSEERGHVIFKFDRRHAPRLKVQQSFVLVKRAAREKWGTQISAWGCSFEEFLSRDEYHTSSSLVLPLYFLKNQDSESLLVGCGGVSAWMFRRIKSALTDGIQVHTLFYETEPPTRYLANLVDYISGNQDDPVLLTRPRIAYDAWAPTPLAYESSDETAICREVLAALAARKCVVLQGPPGTGKSYCAAQIIADYIGRDCSVCVTAMTNKALMELIAQAPLARKLSERRLSKTLLTSDEAISARGLKEANPEYVVPKGEALFATYYKLSNEFRRIKERGFVPLFDLIVVEEASQAYLTTIAAMLRLAKKCLIVGDPMQLSPIVLSENKPEYKRWTVVTQSEGLSTFVLGTDVRSFRITTTFRLTAASATLSGIFYGNMLRSVAPKRDGWDALSGRYFPEAGGIVYEQMEGGEDGVLSEAAATAMVQVVSSLERCRPCSSVAIITPFRDSAKAIQRKFSFSGSRLTVSVETIDRVQGTTVDYAILYFPLRNVGFALNERRFNVATSRSRTTTLILSDFDLLGMRSVTGKVREFLERVVGRDVDGPRTALVEDGCAQSGVHPVCDTSLSEGLLPTMENVEKLKRQVQKKLAEWLKRALTLVYPHGYWHSGVMGAMTENQKVNISRKRIRALDELDLAALLSVFLNKGNLCKFCQIVMIDHEVESLAEHIKIIRNGYAHLDTKSIDAPDQMKLKFHMDTLAMFQRFLERSGAQMLTLEKQTATPSVTSKRGGYTITVQ